MSIYALIALRQQRMNGVASETVNIKPLVTDAVKWLMIAHYADRIKQQERFVGAAIAKGQMEQARLRTQKLKADIKAAIKAGDEERARLLYREFVAFANVVAATGRDLSKQRKQD